MLCQQQINDSISKKFLANDRILEFLDAQLEELNSVIKNQLSFNKVVETQIAQLASSCLNHNTRSLPGQLEVNPKESVNVVTTRARQFGKTIRAETTIAVGCRNTVEDRKHREYRC